MTVEEVIDRISIIRTRANLSARSLSLIINKNPAYITQLETKKCFKPNIDVILDICEVCGVSPEEFFYHDLSAYKSDMETLKFLSTLSEKQKKAIMNLYEK